ncbi:MAG: SIMPL domain-containing protein [Mariniphaga sp.]|nr:SIMPL domain-containing protein [Mariniphaga sp.]
MKHLLFITVLFFAFNLSAQNNEDVRFIEVRGNAEIEVQPNEMILSIAIQEYFEEEFQKNKEPKDYKTKVPLAKIEDGLIKSLRKAGIEKEDIRVRGMGNYWRQQGKEFLFSKQLEVKITDFSKVNQLSPLVDTKGIRSLNVGQMSHSELEKFRKQVKTDALKDAREKAGYLVESLGEELGEVLSITELNDGYSRPFLAKNRMMAAEAAYETVEEVQNISVSYQVTARFRIK